MFHVKQKPTTLCVHICSPEGKKGEGVAIGLSRDESYCTAKNMKMDGLKQINFFIDTNVNNTAHRHVDVAFIIQMYFYKALGKKCVGLVPFSKARATTVPRRQTGTSQRTGPHFVCSGT